MYLIDLIIGMFIPMLFPDKYMALRAKIVKLIHYCNDTTPPNKEYK